jgi:(p)ppGpp synthase/HD superfamily hydrolase
LNLSSENLVSKFAFKRNLCRYIESKLAYLSDFERDEIYAATELAFNAHDGQKRKSGEPFITHPVAVVGAAQLSNPVVTHSLKGAWFQPLSL